MRYCYNFFGLDLNFCDSSQALSEGVHQIRMEFTYDGGGLGRGGAVALYVDGTNVGEGRVERTVAMVFSADETTDIGYEAGSYVAPDYPSEDGRFNGQVNWVEIDVDKEALDIDHRLAPDERLRVAMAFQ